MDFARWKKRLGLERRTHAGSFVAPSFALDLEPGFIAGARLNPAKRSVQSFAVKQLPAGVLVPSANKANLADGQSVRQSIAEVCERVGNSGGRLGLLIPDVAARVALLQFETLPENRQQAETLVLWRMREYLPYPHEEARLSYQVLARQTESVEVLGVAVRASVLAEYEAAMSAINGGPALVLPASVALLPLLPEGEEGQLLLHLCPGALTAVVVAANRVRYWRTRAIEAGAASILDEVGREATRVLATCQDSLGVYVQNVWFCARPPAEPEVEQALSRALGRQLAPLAPPSAASIRVPPPQKGTWEQFGTPFAGLIANSF